MSIAGVQGGRLVGGCLVFIGTSHDCICIALALIASDISIIQYMSLHFYPYTLFLNSEFVPLTSSLFRDIKGENATSLSYSPTAT
jgi:hypothetical protein